jgi:putative ABC transport system substrate-binding protein
MNMPVGWQRSALFMAFACLLTSAVAFAQTGQRAHRVAHVFFTSAIDRPITEVVRLRLAEHSFVQGKNLEFRPFWHRSSLAIASSAEATNQLIAEVIGWQPNVILVNNVNATRMFQRVTSSIPIVFANVQDPEVAGVVASLARPGGNVTGAGTHYDDLVVKRLQLARELLRSARTIAVVMDRRMGGIPSISREVLERTARRMNLTVTTLDIADLDEGLCGAAKHVMHARAQAILPWGSIATPDNYSGKPWVVEGYAECLVKLQRETRLPVLDDAVDSVPQGTVLGLGEDQRDAYRRAADLVASILAGAKPATLPVDMTMRLELFVNARSARELGLTLPQSILVRANRVIE